MTTSKLIEIYKRTLDNCKFYEKEQKPLNLINEIGVLRGVAYCMTEAAGMKLELMTATFEDFLHFIHIQEELKKAEG